MQGLLPLGACLAAQHGELVLSADAGAELRASAKLPESVTATVTSRTAIRPREFDGGLRRRGRRLDVEKSLASRGGIAPASASGSAVRSLFSP